MTHGSEPKKETQSRPRERYRSWGGYPFARHEGVHLVTWRDDPIPAAALQNGSCLSFGNGRSYGDSCLNDGGVLLDTRRLDRFIAFDAETGMLECESGVLLGEILALVVPLGWFLPVTPGTRFVTLGGAIANDVHGKNHHREGTFGHHVRSLKLLRSDGTRLVCSPGAQGPLLRATIGGLGLTGLITGAKLQLKRVAGPYVERALMTFTNIDGYFKLAAQVDRDFEHTVAWVDCSAVGSNLGRGVLTGGNASQVSADEAQTPRHRLSIPLTPPVSLVNKSSVKLFNRLYYRLQRHKAGRSCVHYLSFFYPLDDILSWNRVYGPKGFFQYQCVVPLSRGETAIREILTRITDSGAGSFLAVLKRFGAQPPAGILSFPREGYTLALDFPNHGGKTRALLEALDDVTRNCGGAVYPAKDARMSAESFQTYYPQWREFAVHKDPAFSSSFWRRVTESQA